LILPGHDRRFVQGESDRRVWRRVDARGV
jgi:hypothetical protein